MQLTAHVLRDVRRHPAHKISPVRIPALVALVLLASCGSSNLGERTNPGSSVGDATKVARAGDGPTIDLPGRIGILVRAFDANDVPVGGLEASAFNIFEGGQLVSQTESFQRILPRPEEFRSYQHLIIDRSNSVQTGDTGAIQAAARNYIAQVVGEDESFVKLSWFDGSDGLYEVEDHELGFTDDADALLEAVDDLFSAPTFNPSTNLYGAVLLALDDLEDVDDQAQAEGIDNRALTLVTFTDGTHQVGNNATLAQVVDRLNGTEPAFNSFTIGVGGEIDANALVAIGKDGAVAVDQFGQLSGAFENVVEQIRGVADSFYYLTYCSPKTSGPWELTISVQDLPSGEPDDVVVNFNANGFGAGCAFLDVERRPELEFGLGGGELTAVLDAPDGSVLACGWRSSGCDGAGCGQTAGAFVVRLRASAHDAAAVVDGRLDDSFGDGGSVRLDPLAQVAGATSLAVDETTGTIYVGGWRRPVVSAGPAQAVLWVLNPDGTLAQTVEMPNPLALDQGIEALVRTESGELLAAGFRGTGSRSFAVWRLLADLSVDGAFGDGTGVLLHPETPEFGNEGASELVLAGDGRAYAVGRAGGGIRALALDRITGALRTDFGGTGWVDLVRTFGGIPRDARPGAAALDGQGRLVVGGTLVLPRIDGVLRDQPAVWRVLESGAPDLQFDGSPSSPTHSTGVVTLRAASTNNQDVDFGRATRGRGLCIAPDGTILITGDRENLDMHTDMVVIAFDVDGRTSADYNLVGFVIEDGSNGDDSNDVADLVHVLPSGAIWALGSAESRADSVATPTIWVDRDPSRAFGPLSAP